MRWEGHDPRTMSESRPAAELSSDHPRPARSPCTRAGDCGANAVPVNSAVARMGRDMRTGRRSVHVDYATNVTRVGRRTGMG